MTLSIKERFKISRFIKGEQASNQAITLSHRRIFILPTMAGLGFVCLIVLLLLIAFIYNNNLAYLLAFLLASIFFITILHSFKTLAGLMIKQGQAQAVFAGEAASFEIIINNPQTIDRFNLKAKLDSEVDFLLKPQERKRITLYSVTNNRGWHQMGTVTLSSTYPLGLFRTWSPVRFLAKSLVYPKPNTVELPFPADDTGQNQLLKSQPVKQGRDDFDGIKQYQQGDPVKHIHWKAFAKGQGLFSKQYSGENSASLWLNYQQTPGHNVEERLSQLCRWVLDAEKAGLIYGFKIPGVKLEPSHGLDHYHNCLKALALFNK